MAAISIMNVQVKNEMKIYELRVDTGKKDDRLQYQLVTKDAKFLNDFEESMDGIEKVKDKLSDLKITIIKGKNEADFSILWNGTCSYLVNERSKIILEPLAADAVEFVPIGGNLYLMHVLCAADALDTENIVANIYDNMIGYIRKFAFNPEALPDSEIFKVICQTRIYSSAIFVTDRLKKMVEENHLTGFNFKEIGDF